MSVNGFEKLAPLAAILAAGCVEKQADAAGQPGRTEATVAQNENKDGGTARNRPFAHGRSFATLDEYLAHLHDRAGPIGQPWYRKVGGDTYELVTNTVPRGRPETFTRQQLMERFGFTR
jgi:hypothetical protein